LSAHTRKKCAGIAKTRETHAQSDMALIVVDAGRTHSAIALIEGYIYIQGVP
jgi:hypothetical protein